MRHDARRLFCPLPSSSKTPSRTSSASRVQTVFTAGVGRKRRCLSQRRFQRRTGHWAIGVAIWLSRIGQEVQRCVLKGRCCCTKKRLIKKWEGKKEKVSFMASDVGSATLFSCLLFGYISITSSGFPPPWLGASILVKFWPPSCSGRRRVPCAAPTTVWLLQVFSITSSRCSHLKIWMFFYVPLASGPVLCLCVAWRVQDLESFSKITLELFPYSICWSVRPRTPVRTSVCWVVWQDLKHFFVKVDFASHLPESVILIQFLDFCFWAVRHLKKTASNCGHHGCRKRAEAGIAQTFLDARTSARRTTPLPSGRRWTRTKQLLPSGNAVCVSRCVLRGHSW